MRVNIKQKLDERALNEALEKYKSVCLPSYQPYVIMSRDTMVDIAECFIYKCENKRRESSYDGCRVAIDDALEYGEVEIR